jgi:hypothetical protein
VLKSNLVTNSCAIPSFRKDLYALDKLYVLNMVFLCVEEIGVFKAYEILKRRTKFDSFLLNQTMSNDNVRGVKGLLGLSPLGLISCLLRGLVKPLYKMRGDVSIYASKRLERHPFSLVGRRQSPTIGLPRP